MKRYLSLFAALLLAFSASAFETKRDTTIVEFSDRAVNKRVTVISTGDKELNLPISLNLNDILKELGVDTTERERALVLVGEENGKRDTLVFITQSGQKIQIVTKKPVFTPKADSTIVDNQQADDDWDDEEEEENETHFDWKNKRFSKSDEEKPFFSKSDFGFYFGLNNFANSSPDANGSNYQLRTWPSRYIALSFRKNLTFVSTEKVAMAVSIGPEIAWCNFMFENSFRANYTNNQVSFDELTFATQKSKLVMPYLNLPVLINFGLKQQKIKIAVGGYVGYRVGGRTKTKDSKGNKEKIRGNFGLNNVPYGVTGEIGKKNGITLFFRHDLNTLFKANQQRAKELQAFSVGLRI